MVFGERWDRASLGLKLPMLVFVAIGAVFALFIAVVFKSNTDWVRDSEFKSLQSRAQLIVDLLQASDRELQQRADKVANVFKAKLEGRLSLGAVPLELQGQVAPDLRLDDRSLVGTVDLTDQFTQATAAVATVFVRRGDDFLRVSTSLKNEKGVRVMGTLLDRRHPAYPLLLQGKPYQGIAKLFGRPYVTHYEPLHDAKGQMIAVAFIGLDYSDYLKQLTTTIRQQKVGKTGYLFVLDGRQGPGYGDVLIHPVDEGKNQLTATDADGRHFIQDMLEQKSGVIEYFKANTELGETEPRAKVAAYASMPSWGWVVVASAYVDEFTEDLRRQLFIYVGLGAGLVAAVSLALSWGLRRLILKPMAQACDQAAAMALGDLSARLQTQRRDEVGKLITQINEVSNGVSVAVQAVRQGSESVQSAAIEIAHGNHDLSARTEQQAATLQNTSASMEQLTTSAQHNAEQANQARQWVDQAAAVGQAGREAFQRVEHSMQQIRTSSSRITDITNVIDGIAFQTNLLALNAAVEAARAGEQGRGFAVVAAEVRALASRSATAAREIKALIQESSSQVDDGAQQVEQAALKLDEIASSIAQVTRIASEISLASQEQSRASVGVAESIAQMDQATQQNAALVEQIAAAATSLSAQADGLVEAVAVFRT